MKIALLNLPFDNNYGGNLQRYALIKVLQGMGHEVEHINLHCSYSLPWYKYPYSIPKRIIKKYLLGKKDEVVFLEKKLEEDMKQRLSLASRFYEKYIPHTDVCTNIKQIIEKTSGKFDAYLVGSDQVWRKGSTRQIGLKNYLLDFTKEMYVKRIAYAVSFGVSGNLLKQKEITSIKQNYARFDAVSVREKSALELINDYGWNYPTPSLCLDPTLLLSENDYFEIIDENDTDDLTSGKIFSYILDETEKTKFISNFYKKHLEKEIVKVGLNDTADVSICQWLNNIRCADLVITDSYHGCVFSIIFNRPFVFLGNKGRGNSRIESLFEMLGIKSDDTLKIDYVYVNNKIKELMSISKCFLSSIASLK